MINMSIEELRQAAKYLGEYYEQIMNQVIDDLEAAEKSDAESIAMYRKARDERDDWITKAEAACRDYNALEGYYTELAEKLAAANRAVDEAYQRGYATGQEEIAAELEFAKQEIANLHDDISEWMDKCDALQAKIAEMEQQKPSHWGCTVLQSDGRWKEEVSREAPPEVYFSIRDIFPLYARPGAKGEEK